MRRAPAAARGRATARRPTASGARSPPGRRSPPCSGRTKRELRAQARRWTRPTRASPGWWRRRRAGRRADEKTLVFVAHRETLEMLRTALSHRAQLATGVFHEELPPARRDIEVAQFRQAEGPSLLVSTECGGEGRNFEFCHRLVLFDLPWNPVVVEQRIGRLDRIGRRIPVEIVYFRPPAGIGADVVRLFEAIGLFREPLAGLEPQLAAVEGALEAVALDPDASLSDEALDPLVGDARAARTRIREAAYQQLHRDPYRPEMAERSWRASPRSRRAQRGRGGRGACERLGFHVERAARPPHVSHRVRQRGAGRQPARRPRRLELPRHVRPRRGRRGRDARLLRLGPSARRGRARALSRSSVPARGRAGGRHRSASAASGSWPSTRMARRSRSSRSIVGTSSPRLGRGPAAPRAGRAEHERQSSHCPDGLGSARSPAGRSIRREAPPSCGRRTGRRAVMPTGAG